MQVYTHEQIKEILANGDFNGLSSDENIVLSFFGIDNGERSSLKPFGADILSGGLFFETNTQVLHL